MKLLLWLLLLGWIGPCRAQPQSFSALDAHARTVSAGTDPNLTELVAKLVTPAKTDLEKARVLFVWTATHIHYDTGLMKPYTYGLPRLIDTVAAATRIVQTRRGICSDYALVLYALLRKAGLPARVVMGYAKGHPDLAGAPVRSINHVWNLVQIDGQWHPLDATWASTDNGTRPLNTHYFLTPAHEFAADHLPDNPNPQTLPKPLTRGEFDALPRVYSPYFGLGFGPDFPKQGLFRVQKRLQLSVSISREMEFEVLANRYAQPANTRTFYLRAFRTKKGYDLVMQVFRDGLYSVHILARPKGETTEFQPILTLTVIKE